MSIHMDPSFSVQELKGVLHHVPEIVELVGTADAEQYLSINEEDESGKAKSILQSIFTKLMSAKKDQVAEVVSKLKSRLEVQSQVIEKVASISCCSLLILSDIYYFLVCEELVEVIAL